MLECDCIIMGSNGQCSNAESLVSVFEIQSFAQ